MNIGILTNYAKKSSRTFDLKRTFYPIVKLIVAYRTNIHRLLIETGWCPIVRLSDPRDGRY